MNLDDALQTFFAEARELLEEMEGALLRMGDEADRSESINAVFRAAHTIKGSSGLFGLDSIVAFTHVVESVLDRVRDGTMPLDDELIALLLVCGDHMAKLVHVVEMGNGTLADADREAGDMLWRDLNARLTGGADAGTLTPDGASHPAPDAVSTLDTHTEPRADTLWNISLRFGANVLRNGMDPLSFIRYLGTIGTIEQIRTIPDAIPPLDALDPESCYLGFEIVFASDADQSTIENVFEFVIDDCDVQVREVHPDTRGGQPDAGGDSPAQDSQAVHAGAPEPTAPGAMLDGAAPSPTTSVSTALVDSSSTASAPGDASVSPTKGSKPGKAQENQSIRVDADKLDRLIDLVGELITATASANVMARRVKDAELQECTATLSSLVEEVRDSALQLRMVKIGGTFSRFRRVVHDVARELGKDIELQTNGEDTELDKTVVEKIGDPLMHLVRNAIDHGIDSPEARLARGKPAQGTVALNAYHDSGSIVIEVVDDGGGLDSAKILAKATERGLVEPGKTLSEAEIHNLIFEPGFSTADQITNLSGRGVGMDVVKRNITALRGSVRVASSLGRGTTVTVRLPLTLAIINGFQVGVGKSVFVIPLETVDECITWTPSDKTDFTDLRGAVLPFVRLRDLFDIAGEPAARQNIVVVKHVGHKFGLVVDRLMGEAQTVIKPLSKLFGSVQGISGSSILGSGEVALILDVPALLQHVQNATGSSIALDAR